MDEKYKNGSGMVDKSNKKPSFYNPQNPNYFSEKRRVNLFKDCQSNQKIKKISSKKLNSLIPHNIFKDDFEDPFNFETPKIPEERKRSVNKYLKSISINEKIKQPEAENFKKKIMNNPQNSFKNQLDMKNEDIFLSFGDREQKENCVNHNTNFKTPEIADRISRRKKSKTLKEKQIKNVLSNMENPNQIKNKSDFKSLHSKSLFQKKKVKTNSNMINLTKLFGLLKKSKENEKKCQTKVDNFKQQAQNKHYLIKARTEQMTSKLVAAKQKVKMKEKKGQGANKSNNKKKKLPKIVNNSKENDQKKAENNLEKQTSLENKNKNNKLVKMFMHQYKNQKKVYETPVAFFRSGDTHIKRFLKQMGVEIRTQGIRLNNFGILEEIKWVVQDRKSDYRRLRSTQLFNHFENIDELTRKTSLSRNLENNFQISLFYPQTFSLSVKEERRSFKEEFYLRVSFKLLKNHVLYFIKKKPKLIAKIRKFLDKKWKRYFTLKETNLLSKDTLFFDNYRNKYVDLTNTEKSPDFIVNSMLLNQMLYLWESLARRLTSVEDEVRFFSPLKFDKDMWNRFQKYADHSLDYESLPISEMVSIGISEEYWKTPSMSLIIIILDLDSLFRLKIKEYREHCDQNLWIIKPSCNSKGTGIFISKNIKEIRKSWKNNVNRIIQKYLEDCLIIDKKKFDLRVWVFIESINPLKIWVFKDYYARLCFDDFDLNKLDLTRHLTNFSLNKEKFENNLHKSVMQKSVLISKIKK